MENYSIPTRRIADDASVSSDIAGYQKVFVHTKINSLYNGWGHRK